MRLIHIAAIAALLLPSVASAQQAPTRLRDCIRQTEAGISAPTSKRPGAKWLFITIVMKQPMKPGGPNYGSTVGWKVAGSLKEACEAAITDFTRESEDWMMTGATAELVPDSIVRQGSAH